MLNAPSGTRVRKSKVILVPKGTQSSPLLGIFPPTKYFQALTKAVISIMALALASAAQLKPDIRLAQAVSDFEADLSTEQKAVFRKDRSTVLTSLPKMQDVMRLTAEFDRTCAKGGRCFGPRLVNMAQAVQQFTALGDIIVGGSQNIVACGIWTVFRMSLLVSIGVRVRETRLPKI